MAVRRYRTQEVAGSSPASSTQEPAASWWFHLFPTSFASGRDVAFGNYFGNDFRLELGLWAWPESSSNSSLRRAGRGKHLGAEDVRLPARPFLVSASTTASDNRPEVWAFQAVGYPNLGPR